MEAKFLHWGLFSGHPCGCDGRMKRARVAGDPQTFVVLYRVGSRCVGECIDCKATWGIVITPSADGTRGRGR